MNPSFVSTGELLARPATITGESEATIHWVVSAIKQQDGQYIVVSRYGDAQWQLIDGATNTNRKIIDFTTLPECFQANAKGMFYRLILRGREGRRKPMAGTVVTTFNGVGHFLKWLSGKQVTTLSGITPLHCINYVHHCKRYKKANGQGLGVGALNLRYFAVEAIYELSQYTNTPHARASLAGIIGMAVVGFKQRTKIGQDPMHPWRHVSHIVPKGLGTDRFCRVFA